MNDGHWQMEGSAAELYQRYLVPAITSKWAGVAGITVIEISAVSAAPP